MTWPQIIFTLIAFFMVAIGEMLERDIGGWKGWCVATACWCVAFQFINLGVAT